MKNWLQIENGSFININYIKNFDIEDGTIKAYKKDGGFFTVKQCETNIDAIQYIYAMLDGIII